MYFGNADWLPNMCERPPDLWVSRKSGVWSIRLSCNLRADRKTSICLSADVCSRFASLEFRNAVNPHSDQPCSNVREVKPVVRS